MPRIAGVDLPPDKNGVIALAKIFGIGKARAQEILTMAGVDWNKKVRDWTDEELVKIRYLINTRYTVEGALRAQIQMNIKRLMDIGCYRGLRHRKGLPVRGQKTRKNARTRKGKRKTVATRKKPPAPK